MSLSSYQHYAYDLHVLRSEQLQREAATHRVVVAARHARKAARLHRRAVKIAERADAFATRADLWVRVTS